MSGTLPPPGTVYAVERIFRQADFDLFARISGDDNPIHVDPAFSARTRFGRTVAHGMLLYTALRGQLDARFPRCRQLSHAMTFPAPTFADEPVRLEIEVSAYPSAGCCDLALRVIRVGDRVVTLDGHTVLELAAPFDPAMEAGQ